LSTEHIQLDQYCDTPAYNTKAVSIRTGVPADTLRAWERRYGVPKPHRTPGAQRLYSERDIAEIRWLKQRTETGVSIKQAVALLRSTARSEVAQTQPKPDPEPDTAQSFSELLFLALTKFDSAESDRILAKSFSRFGVEATCLEVVEPAMYRIGDEWAEGRSPIAVEHFASHFVRAKLTGLIMANGQSGSAGPVVAACAPGEHHEIGLLVFALLLIRRGVKVYYLGADMPGNDLAIMIERARPKVVCLSASTLRNAEALFNTARMIQRMDCAPKVYYGGYAFIAAPELRDRFEDTWLGTDAVSAADAVREIAVAP